MWDKQNWKLISLKIDGIPRNMPNIVYIYVCLLYGFERWVHAAHTHYTAIVLLQMNACTVDR